MARPTLHLTIMDAEKKKYEGDIYAASSFNEAGPFDILPYHANFISIIKDKVIVHEVSGENKEFPFQVAVLKALNNNLTIFLGIEEIKLQKETDETTQN